MLAGRPDGPVEAFLRMMQEAPPLSHSQSELAASDGTNVNTPGPASPSFQHLTIRDGLQQFEALRSSLQAEMGME